MRKNLALTTLTLWIIAAAPLWAQTSSSFANLGTSWLKISPSTRDTALGDSGAALGDAFDEADLNPAALGMIGGTYISLSQDFWAQNLSMEHLVFTEGDGKIGYAFGANFMNFGAIDTYNVSGSGTVLTSTGSYSPVGLNVYGGMGFNLSGGLRAGLAAHFIYDNVEQNFPDQTGSFDLGVFYQQPGSLFSISEVLTNVGWSIDNSPLPMQVKTAAAFQMIPHTLNLSGEADWFMNSYGYTQYGLGAELWFKNAVALRGGYQFSNTGDLTGTVGLSLGAGIRFSDWELDYAFVSLGELGIANQIGLSLKLGDMKTPTPAPRPTPMVTATPMPELPTLPAPAPAPPPPAPTPAHTFMELYRSGIERYQAKDYDGALKDLKTAITIYDKTVKRYYYAEAFAMIGVIYKFNRPDPFLAHKYCDIALKIDHTTETAKKLKYEIDASNTETEKRYWEGMDYFGNRQYDAAIRVLRTVIRAKDKTTPSFFFAEAYKTLGIIYELYRPNHKKAVECFKAGLKIEPKDTVAQQHLDKLLSR